ncbi:hypothetical protein [Longimicrobium sp.]|uniref:hypothetical protein n=1 Tax=Longimicrobium sp. TaxID=2029185 RepID=UPI002ED7E66F
MNARGGRLRATLGVLGAFALAWGASRALAKGWDGAPGRMRTQMAPPTAAGLDSATIAVQGALTTGAASATAASMPRGMGLLVVLRRADILTCEDLGRQLRELESRGGGLPLVVMADTGAAEELRAFVRRERVKAAVVEVETRQVLNDTPALFTPAVLVVRDGGARVAGIVHPKRFSNARVRSFADELGAHLD